MTVHRNRQDRQDTYLRQLQRSNRALEEFAYAVSHDLQAPVRHLSQSAEMLFRLLDASAKGETKEYLNLIRTSTKRMREMINGLLTLSRAVSHEVSREQVDTASLVADLKTMIEEGQDRKVVIEIGELPTLCGDRALLSQLFQNLLENACKFSARNDAPHVSIHSQQEGDRWVIRVKDNGIGLGDEDPSKMFRIFRRSQLAKDIPGTGVGLVTCERIVNQHGGSIVIGNNEDQGCYVNVKLPFKPVDS